MLWTRGRGGGHAAALALAGLVWLAPPSHAQPEPAAEGAPTEEAAVTPVDEGTDPAPDADGPPPAVDVVASVRSHWDGLRAQGSELQRWEQAYWGAERGERDLAFARWFRGARAYLEQMRSLVDRVVALPDTPEGDALRDEVRSTLSANLPRVDGLLEESARRLNEALEGRTTVGPDGREAQEDRIERARERITIHERLTLEFLGSLGRLDVDVSAATASVQERVEQRAEDLITRLALAQEALSDAEERAADAPDDATLDQAVALAERRLEGAVAAMRDDIALLRTLDVPVAEYEREVFLATGEITGDVLDREVLTSVVRTWVKQGVDTIRASGSTWLVRLVVFLLIVVASRVAAALVRRFVARSLPRAPANLSVLAREMIETLSGRLVMLLGILVGLAQVGIDLAPVLAGLGVVGFVVGFALQDTLANFAAGAMILLYRPFDVDDLVEVAGSVFGRVSHMTLVSTTIVTFDNQVLVVPNSRIWGDVIKNITAQETRRVDMTLGVSYGADLAHVDRVLRSILDEHPLVLEDPPPVVEVQSFGDSSVDLIVRPWCRTQDYWTVYWAVHRSIKDRFDAEGIEIPFPQRDVNVRMVDRAPAAEDAPRS